MLVEPGVSWIFLALLAADSEDMWQGRSDNARAQRRWTGAAACDLACVES
jgi:hypothetical protein